MLKLEEERKKKKHLTAEEVEDEHFRNATLKKAHDLRIEQIDQVKNMVRKSHNHWVVAKSFNVQRRKMMYAQCAKIREAQIKEKQALLKQKSAFDERQDLLMEIERLKTIQRIESEEKKRRSENRKDAEQIRVQIAERQREKILEEEMLEQEKAHMKEMILKQEEEAAQARKAKLQQGKQLLAEVLEANAIAIRAKQSRKAEER